MNTEFWSEMYGHHDAQPDEHQAVAIPISITNTVALPSAGYVRAIHAALHHHLTKQQQDRLMELMQADGGNVSLPTLNYVQDLHRALTELAGNGPDRGLHQRVAKLERLVEEQATTIRRLSTTINQFRHVAGRVAKRIGSIETNLDHKLDSRDI